MEWELYANWKFDVLDNWNHYLPFNVGFITNENSSTDDPEIKVFVSIRYDSECFPFIDKIGHLFRYALPPNREKIYIYDQYGDIAKEPIPGVPYTCHLLCDKNGKIVGRCNREDNDGHHRFILGEDKASRLIAAARDLGTVHTALAEPLEKIIRSIEKATHK